MTAVLDTLEAVLPALDEIIAGYREPRVLVFKFRGKEYPFYIREIKIKEMDAQIRDEAAGTKDLEALARRSCRLIAKKDGSPMLDANNPEHVARMAELGVRFLADLNKAAEQDEAPAEGKLTWREEFKHILALELGWSVARLSREMTEREFRSWLRFSRQRLMPSQRIEVYLAQIASVVAQSVGNELTIKDFLLDFGRKKAKREEKESATAIAAWLPARRVVKGVLKKKRVN